MPKCPKIPLNGGEIYDQITTGKGIGDLGSIQKELSNLTKKIQEHTDEINAEASVVLE